MTPQRIQLRRTKGWRKPDNTVTVARPSKWGNPFIPSNEGHRFWYVKAWGRRFGCERDKDEASRLAVDLYRNAYERRVEFGLPDPIDLRGKNLACWCPLDQPCHADVLLDLANRGAA
jgi:hypothetical protein